MLYNKDATIKQPFVWQDILLYEWNTTSFFLDFININAARAMQDGRGEVL
jgi:hypothetical protein